MSFETDFDSAFTILLGKAAGVIVPTGIPAPVPTSTGTTTAALTAGIEFVLDGGGSAITTGIKGGLVVPFPCQLQQVVLQEFNGTTGSISVDIKKAASGSSPSFTSITGGNNPTIGAGRYYTNDTLGGWTVNFDRGDLLQFSVSSVSLFTRLTVMLYVRRTDANGIV